MQVDNFQAEKTEIGENSCFCLILIDINHVQCKPVTDSLNIVQRQNTQSMITIANCRFAKMKKQQLSWENITSGEVLFAMDIYVNNHFQPCRLLLFPVQSYWSSLFPRHFFGHRSHQSFFIQVQVGSVWCGLFMVVDFQNGWKMN